MKRVTLDVASQALPIATTFLDRLLLTSILVRGLGVERFEYWSLAISAAGLLAIVDSGFLMNFSNLVTRHVERGERDKAIAVYRQSNTIFLALGLVAALVTLALALSTALQTFAGIAPGRFASHALVVIGALGAATALRLALSNISTIYRVSLEFGRGTLLTSAAEVVRILAVSGAVLAGGGLREAAIAHLLGTMAGLGAIAFGDAGRRHPGFRFKLAMPRRDALSGSLRNALAFGLPLIPFIAINQVPVLALGGATALGSGAVAVFVLMRTLANVAQSIIGKVTNVFAMEIARHGLRGDDARARQLLAPLGRLSAIVFGVGAGVFIGFGAGLTALWTGSASLYDARVIALLMAPMIVAPGYLLARSYIMYRNTPRAWTIGSFAHALLALAIYAAGAGLDPVIRISLALALGEILALSIPLTMIAMGGFTSRVLIEQASNLLVALAALAATIAIARVTAIVLGTATWPGLAVGLGVTALLGGLALAATALPVYRSLRPAPSASLDHGTST